MREFLKELYHIWITERPNQLAASLAYFGLFSFAPVIFIAVSIAGLFFKQIDLMSILLERLESTLGAEFALFVEESVVTLSQTTQGGLVLTTVISFIALLLAASGLFFQLQFRLHGSRDRDHHRDWNHCCGNRNWLQYQYDWNTWCGPYLFQYHKHKHEHLYHQQISWHC